MINTLRIMTTSECNNNCSYCFVKTAPGYSPECGDFARIKEAMAKIEYNSLELIGGEPFHNVGMIVNIFENNTKPVTFFTSGTYNQDEVFDLCMRYKDKFPIAFKFSYDGKFSQRNKDNHEIVTDTIKKFKKEFAVSIRWSINREDIPYVYNHFKEFHEMGIDDAIFFPMKYADYTPSDIEVFKEEFEVCLDYCISNHINFNKLLSDNDELIYMNKEGFFCTEEYTILPNGKFTNCYVAYASSGFLEDLVADEPTFNTLRMETPARCSSCFNIFNGCNKCPGNLREYQIKTGNEFFNSYCNLMNELSTLFIKKRLSLVPGTIIKLFGGARLLNIIVGTQEGVCYYKAGGKL